MHEQFLEILHEEVTRARAFRHVLAVLSIQATGATTHLSNWFAALRKTLRPIDTLAIYSSNCVEVLLPNASAADAKELVIAVCQKAEQARLVGGIALFPSSGSTAEELIQASRRALLTTRAAEDSVQVAESRGVSTVQARSRRDAEYVVESPPMRAIMEFIERMTKSSIPVLITGETGTGKELAAHAIHRRGKRRNRTMISINCAAIPEQLIEGMLFGHKKGAYTGAETDAAGVFEAANGGTVFLDEIGEMTQAAQAKLLRVIEQKTVTPLGSTKEKAVDVRILAATQHDLEQLCKEGSFRWDLFFRINTVTIKLPPLRERVEDIPPLVTCFIRQANASNDCAVKACTEEALRLLCRYSWPGNVRELKNTIERAVVLACEDRISTEGLPEKVRLFDPFGGPRGEEEDKGKRPTAENTPMPKDFSHCVAEFEASLIREALEKTGGNQTKASKLLGLPLRTLLRKIDRYQLKRFDEPSS